MGTKILYPNREFAHWNGNRYFHDYNEDKENDEDLDLYNKKNSNKIKFNIIIIIDKLLNIN